LNGAVWPLLRPSVAKLTILWVRTPKIGLNLLQRFACSALTSLTRNILGASAASATLGWALELELTMKKIALAAALSLAASTAFAGGVVVPTTPTDVVVTKTSSSAGGLVVPLLLLLVLAAAASN
jgi:hypothetical protein